MDNMFRCTICKEAIQSGEKFISIDLVINRLKNTQECYIGYADSMMYICHRCYSEHKLRDVKKLKDIMTKYCMPDIEFDNITQDYFSNPIKLKTGELYSVGGLYEEGNDSNKEVIT